MATKDSDGMPSTTTSKSTFKDKKNSIKKVRVLTQKFGNGLINIKKQNSKHLSDKVLFASEIDDGSPSLGNTKLSSILELKEIISSCPKDKLDEFNNSGETLLMQAATMGRIDLVKSLLEQGVNPNIQHSFTKETALHFAVSNGHVGVVAILIEGVGQSRYTEINLHDREDLNCLHVACLSPAVKGENGKKIIRLLVENGIPIDSLSVACSSYSPLHFLCSIAHLGSDSDYVRDRELVLVKTLCLEFNADPCIVNSKNELPLHLAAKRGHERLCEFLLHRMSYLSTEDDFKQYINIQDASGNSPLHLAIVKKKLSLINLFKMFPYDWNLRNTNSETPQELYNLFILKS